MFVFFAVEEEVFRGNLKVLKAQFKKNKTKQKNSDMLKLSDLHRTK